MKKIILTTLCCLTAALTSAREKSPVTIIMQVSDPQMGFYADNRDMAYETRTLTKTVEAINRLRPDVVVFTGDYVHNAADESQWTEFLRIVAEINPRMPIADCIRRIFRQHQQFHRQNKVLLC